MISYMEKITLVSFFLHYISGLSGIRKMLMLVLFSVLQKTLIRNEKRLYENQNQNQVNVSESRTINEKVEVLK